VLPRAIETALDSPANVAVLFVVRLIAQTGIDTVFFDDVFNRQRVMSLHDRLDDVDANIVLASIVRKALKNYPGHHSSPSPSTFRVSFPPTTSHPSPGGCIDARRARACRISASQSR